MSDQDHIFLSCDAEPGQIAEWLAAEFGMEIKPHEHWGLFVERPARVDPTKRVGGLVQKNYLVSNDEEELTDGYPIIFEWTYTGRDDVVQLEEAKRMFAELAERVTRPMVLMHGFGTLVGGFTPDAGLVWFPPRTWISADNRDLWEPFRA